MRIDSVRIRAERQKRAWSQQHLATVTALGLRTIQRIEKEGTAAYESAQALAACFEVPLEALMTSDVAQAGSERLPSLNPPPTIRRRISAGLGMAAAFVAGAALMSVQGVVAEDLLVDMRFVDSTRDEQSPPQRVVTSSRIVMTSGESMEVTIPGTGRLVILPRILGDGQVYFELSVYDDDEPAEPRYRPALVALNGQEAQIIIGDATIGNICIALRPTLLTEQDEANAGERSDRTIEPFEADCRAPAFVPVGLGGGE